MNIAKLTDWALRLDHPPWTASKGRGKQRFRRILTPLDISCRCCPYRYNEYKKSTEDKHILEPDEKTAWIIMWIFEMAAYQGYGYNKIARVLTERKVTTPAAYQAQQAGRSYNKEPTEWNLTTVYHIISDETYLGHLISGKRRIASFKNKKVIHKPKEEWIVVENRFPPLIDEKLWNAAHERLRTRKRETSNGFVNIFAGLVKCGDCGYALGITNAKTQKNYFVCQTYSKKGREYCTSHYIT